MFPLDPIVWNQATLDNLKVLDNKWIWAIDFWFTQVKEGYIIDFFVEYNKTLKEAKRKFEKDPRKQMVEEIMLWIKMLFVERRMMCMKPDRMTK
jgi:hypothetical protein